MQREPHNNQTVEWLKFIIAFLLFIILLIVNTFIAEPNYDSFWSRVLASLNNTIPSLIAALIAFMAIYYFLHRKGLTPIRSTKLINQDELSNSIVSGIIEEMSSRERQRGVKFFDQFYSLQWDNLLPSCSRLDICVHYFDNWVSQNRRPLLDFIEKGGTIRIVLPNFKNEEVVRQINSRFEEDSTEQRIAEKINNTKSRLEVLQRESNRTNILEVYFTDHMIWYCGIRLDNRVLILSPFEHRRNMRVEAPVVIIQLDENREIREWFDKEFSWLIQNSTTL